MRTVLEHSAFRYLLVGGFAFLLDLGLLALTYRVLGAPLWLATAVGFWGSFAFNFTLQRRYAFGGAMPTGPALWRYGVLLAANSLANIAVVGVFEHLGWGFAVGKVAVTVAQTVWNYFAYRYWVFGGRAAPTPPADDRAGPPLPVEHDHKES
ncbi:putative flippase GtrA [Cellulosimicrobium cellulans]|uniref:GtrA family protein n=1 Tax=Cellulosimicrobium cellulans TaxID=1710 RepID=UPI0019592F03|nr:GtrA family protein [Cellulosimicrobium cellulans]MBM7820876.1 putative flippase GtrA [Cellulosimicrobium cellulans]